MDILGKIGSLIGGVAPTIATMLGGPLAGAATSLLSGALGVANDPSSILSFLEKGGTNISAILQSAETTAKEKYGYLTEGVKSDAIQGQAINTTIQAEVAAGVSWYHWRHLIGYATLIWALFPVPPLAIYMWQGNVTVLNALIGVLGGLISWFAILAGLNGYVAMDTSRRQSAALTGTPVGTLLGTIVNAFKR